MNSQKLSGAVSCLAAILILAADKIFAPVCKGTMELANGGECMMRCHYYGIALFLFGLLLLAESVLFSSEHTILNYRLSSLSLLF